MAEENDNVEVVETDKTTAGSEQPKPQDEKKYTDTDVDAIIDELAGDQPIPDERQLAEMSANGGGPQGVDMEMQDGAMSTGLAGLTPETGGEYANPNSML